MRKTPDDNLNAEPAPEPETKKLFFVSGAHKDMRSMPETVQDAFGYDLWLIQNGETPANASPFEGSQGSNIMKLSERHDGDTYRCVYAAKFEKAVFVLHVFQKKSRSGIATPQTDIDVVSTRFAAAKELYAARFPTEENK